MIGIYSDTALFNSRIRARELGLIVSCPCECNSGLCPGGKRRGTRRF